MTIYPNVISEKMDLNVRPGNDFFRFVNGAWLANAQIDSDKSSAGASMDLYKKTLADLQKILAEISALPGSKAKASSDIERVGGLYNSFLNSEILDELGVKPLESELALVQQSTTHSELAAVLERLSVSGVPGLVDIDVEADQNDPTVEVLWVAQGRLGLPNESYYKEKQHAETLAKYREHIAKVAQLADLFGKAATHDEELAQKIANDVVDFETEIAKHHWPLVDVRDSLKINNPMSFTEFKKLTPGHDWDAAVRNLGLPSDLDYLINITPSAISGMLETFYATDLETLQNWVSYRIFAARAPYLGTKFNEAQFALQKLLSGQPEQAPRWERALSLIDSLVGEALGKVYVERHFPAEYKEKMLDLVNRLMQAYQQSISNLEWMSAQTKQKALDKLAKFQPIIGYPDEFLTYEELEIDAKDLLGNVRRGIALSKKRLYERIGKSTKKDRWLMSPQTINAYYHPMLNVICFPAAILQPPFFDPEADDAWNYGAIGAVIGHEIGHGFDDQGSLYDGDGRLQTWWTEDDRQKFEERTGALIAQYNSYCPKQLENHPDREHLHVNGEFTIGENIGDLGGLGIAELAYGIFLQDKGLTYETAPVIEGATALQRFYYSWANAWRNKMRDELVIQRLSVDVHSPAEFRCNGVVRNLDSFYTAFDVQPNDELYLAPEQRVRIWR